MRDAIDSLVKIATVCASSIEKALCFDSPESSIPRSCGNSRRRLMAIRENWNSAAISLKSHIASSRPVAEGSRLQYNRPVMRNIEPLDKASVVDLPYLIRRAAQQFPQSIAVEDGTHSYRLGEVVERAERFANELDALNLGPNASIGILSENRAEYVEIEFGIALARHVRVALNSRLHLEEHLFVASDSEMRLLIHSGAFEETAAAFRERGIPTISIDGSGGGSLDYTSLVLNASPLVVVRRGAVEDPAWLTYTSGTTGRPKGIELSHRAIREVANNLLIEFGPIGPGKVLVLPQPLSHGAGYFVLPWLMCGAGVYLMHRFDPEEVFDLGKRDGNWTLKCVPAMLPPLLDVNEGLPFGYEAVIYGASPVSPPVLDAALSRFGPVFAQIYGQSEAPVTITCLRQEDHLGSGDQRFSAGRPWRTVAIEVRDDSGNALPAGEAGEIAISGAHMMTGYRGLPDLTDDVFRGGWIMTRDTGVFDERGFLRILGRNDEMIISGGFNISPREVEMVVCTLPGVEEVSVVGVPDERWGSAVAAIVKIREGSGISAEEIISFVKPRLGIRTPKVVHLVDSIPKTPYGKVNRKAVMDVLTGDQNEEVMS
jgi:fatty-acyl-CoA synthase